MRTLTFPLIFLLATLAAPAWAAPPSVEAADAEGSVIAIDTSGNLGAWTLPSMDPLRTIRNLNPALANLRTYSVMTGDAVAPGETVRLLYGGMDRSYVTIFEYLPDGRVSVVLKNQAFDRMEARNWYFDVAADVETEGAQTYVVVTSRAQLPEDGFEQMALAPQNIRTDDVIVGTSFAWFRVMNQTGTRIDISGGAAIDPNQPTASGNEVAGSGNNSGQQTPTQGGGTSGSRGPVDQSLMNPYADWGGITANQANPYYRPIPRAGTAYRYNPFLRNYGQLPYYSPAPFQIWAMPGASIGQPYYLFNFDPYAIPNAYYIVPGGRGVRTNFNDVIFNADINQGGIVLSAGDSFIEGEISLGSNSGFNLRLRGVRGSQGQRFFAGQGQQPIIVFIDGVPRIPVIDPNTGDFIVPLSAQMRSGMAGGLGSRIRVQPANIRTGPIGIQRIEIEPIF